MQQVTIYREPERYAGWPANYGMWAWGDEVVLGFVSGFHGSATGLHARNRSRPFETIQARSLDGGVTWVTGPIPAATPGGRALSADEHMEPALQAAAALDQADLFVAPAQQNFLHPNFAMLCARTGLGAGTRAWFYTTTDRCRSWQGPYLFPSFSVPGVAARTDYHILVGGSCVLFLTATGSVGELGSRVFCARTVDGGNHFERLSFVTPEYGDGFAIMPAGATTADGGFLVAVRCKDVVANRSWIDLYRSDSRCLQWEKLDRPVADTGSNGNPPALTKLADGRLCLTYGSRVEPYGIHAIISDDNGLNWSEPVVLRDGTPSKDIGYPRTVQRADDSLVTAYYYSDEVGGAGYIAATIWRP